MLKLNVLEILENKGKSKYWLFQQLDMTYTNFNNIITNKTKSIKYDNIEYVNKVLNVYDSGKRYIFDIELKELKEGWY